MKISIHWVLYPLLLLVAIGAIWYLHTSNVKDAAAAQVVKVDKNGQANTDKQVTQADTVAQLSLTTQNALLDKQLTAAKTLAQQIALINASEGVHLVAQVENPSLNTKVNGTVPVVQEAPKVEIPASEIPEIAKQAVDFKEAENQVAADAVQIAGDKEQIASRDITITGQNAEITQLKGGSKFKRILKTAEHIGIGVGIGIVIAEVKK